MSSIDYFLISHDIAYLHKKTDTEFKYLLVGNQQIDDKNIISCRLLQDNIEHLPKLCSYTAWYAIAKNTISDKKIVSLLEYDIELSSNFSTINEDIIPKTNDNYVIAYSETLLNHYVFYKSTPWLEIALKYIYNINLHNFIDQIKDKYKFWPTTTNMTMPIAILKQFVNWFHPMATIFAKDELGAYVHERAFFIFCVLHNIDIYMAPKNALVHKQLQSHNNQDVYGYVLSKYNSTKLELYMIPEYNLIYRRHLHECYGKLHSLERHKT